MPDPAAAAGTADGATDDNAAAEAATAAAQAATAAAAADPDAELLAGARDPDAVSRAIKAEREAAKEAKRERDAFAAKVQEYEDRDKTDQQKKDEALQAAQAEAAALKVENLRQQVAIEKGLTGERAGLASRLQGSTLEELRADADDLLKLVPAENGTATSFSGGSRGTPPNQDGMDGLIRSTAAARRG